MSPLSMVPVTVPEKVDTVCALSAVSDPPRAIPFVRFTTETASPFVQLICIVWAKLTLVSCPPAGISSKAPLMEKV